MRRNNTLLASVAVAAVTALLGACSESDADSPDKADERSSSSPTRTEDSSAPTDETSAPTDEVDLPDGVLPLPERAPGDSSVNLAAGRYRVPLSSTLAFDVTVPDGTSAHDDGLFIATEDFVVKTEIAFSTYGLPQHPCTDQTIVPVGPTVDDLVQAIGKLPVYRVTRPERVELGGGEGFYVEARVPRTYDASECEGEAVQLPGNPMSPVSGPPPYLGRWWILDIDGQRVVVQQNCWGCGPHQFDRSPQTPTSITFSATS